MSNTGQIKRYDYVGDNLDGIEPDDDGEFVTYDDHIGVVQRCRLSRKHLKKQIEIQQWGLSLNDDIIANLQSELATAEQRISELEKELNDTKYLLSISSNMIRALNATE
jgi:septal ring factor EnvC (AmiA/AmiB activator)